MREYVVVYVCSQKSTSFHIAIHFNKRRVWHKRNGGQSRWNRSFQVCSVKRPSRPAEPEKSFQSPCSRHVRFHSPAEPVYTFQPLLWKRLAALAARVAQPLVALEAHDAGTWKRSVLIAVGIRQQRLRLSTVASVLDSSRLQLELVESGQDASKRERKAWAATDNNNEILHGQDVRLEPLCLLSRF